jgi:hypothetical protein
MRITPTFVMGVDVGQAHDPTAVVVLQRAGDWGELIHLRHVERIALATSYPDQAKHLAELAARPPLTGRVVMGVDATGVGRPVVDMLKPIVGCPLTPVVITAGTLSSADDRGWLRVPKRDLIAGAQIALEQHQVRIAKSIPDVDILTAELAAYRVSINPDSGHDSYANSARENPHDDLVLAFAVAVHVARRRGWGKPITPRPHDVPVNVDYLALQADPGGMLERWAETVPPQARPSRTVGYEPLAGWWNQ